MRGDRKALISIHALLAESDRVYRKARYHMAYFYPRSPCGERQKSLVLLHGMDYYFYPRSPCGERQPATGRNDKDSVISIHALLAESDPGKVSSVLPGLAFLSTLSLRRATWARGSRVTYVEFLSTLSLRRATCHHINRNAAIGISIHALLAESDAHAVKITNCHCHFYPRSPCGERRS